MNSPASSKFTGLNSEVPLLAAQGATNKGAGFEMNIFSPDRFYTAFAPAKTWSPSMIERSTTEIVAHIMVLFLYRLSWVIKGSDIGRIDKEVTTGGD